MTTRSKNPEIRSIINSLETENSEYEILLPGKQLSPEWLEANFPIAWWGRIDWQQVSSGECYQWNTETEAADYFHEICQKKEIENPIVVIAWTNALNPEIKLRLEAVKKHLLAILQADLDTWIMCPSDKWVIEMYHEGEMCFGKSE